MRYLLLLVGGVLAVGFVVSQAQADHLRCHTGNALGFVAIKADPPHLVGTLPGRFTGNPDYFEVRYNCSGQSVHARRVALGLYDIRFPGINPRIAVADAISSEGVSTSVQPLADGIVRVSLRGPLAGADVASRRDVPFSVVVF